MSQQFEWLPIDLQSAPRPAPLIELVGFPDCPQMAQVRTSLATALAGSGSFAEVDQHALPVGDPRRAYPCPTILVNGRDLFGLPCPSIPPTGCRQYPGGLPDDEALSARLRAVSQ